MGTDLPNSTIEIAPADVDAFRSGSWVAWATTGFVALGILLRAARATC